MNNIKFKLNTTKNRVQQRKEKIRETNQKKR